MAYSVEPKDFNIDFKSLEEIETFKQNLTPIKTSNSNGVSLNFSFAHYSSSTLNEIANLATLVSQSGYSPEVRIFGNNLEFKKSDLANILEYEKLLKSKNIRVLITDKENLYSVQETVKAYVRAQKEISRIKEMKLSPFERFLAVYQFVTGIAYKDDDINKGVPRNVISALSSNEIICVGYSKLLKFMCDAVNIPCIRQMSLLENKFNKNKGYHESNVVKIKDEKYGIDGYFYADACWDNVYDAGEKGLKYNHCLIPLADAMHTKYDCKFFHNTKLLYEDVSPEIIYEFFEDEKKLARIIKQFNLTGSLKLGINKQNYEEKRREGIKKLLEKLKQFDISPDIYTQYNLIPTSLSLESLFALCIDFDKNKELIEICLQKLKTGQFAKSSADLEEMKMKTSYGEDKVDVEFENAQKISDIYAVLENFSKEPSDAEERHFAIKFLKKAEIERFVFDEMNRIKNSSDPILIFSYKKALKRILIKSGYFRDRAEKIAQKQIEYSIVRAERKFDDDASNCFRREHKNVFSR